MKDSNKKCNGLHLTPPQGKAARRGGLSQPPLSAAPINGFFTRNYLQHKKRRLKSPRN